MSSSSISSTYMSRARSSVMYGSATTTFMPKARARWITAAPMRPAPITPRVLPDSWAPRNVFRSQRPALSDRSAGGMCRAADNRSANASSAVETVFPAGAFITATPRRVAASRSMLSSPTPARPTTLRLSAASSSSASACVPLRTIKPAAPTRPCSSSARLQAEKSSTWSLLSASRIATPSMASASASTTLGRSFIPVRQFCRRSLRRGPRGSPPARPSCGRPCGRSGW